MDELISRRTAISAVGFAMSDSPSITREDWNAIIDVLGGLPSAQPEIIRCRDCKHRGEMHIADGRYWCDIHNAFMYYCSDAERRTDG